MCKLRTGFVSNSSSSSFIISMPSINSNQLFSLLTDPDKIAPLGIDIILDLLESKIVLETDNHVDYLMYDYLLKLNICDYKIVSY